jgi:hypothetical protein
MIKIYIKFKTNHGARVSDGKPETWLTKTSKKAFIKVLTTIIPLANPDFDEKINEVDEWLVELDEEEIPRREIGINDKRETIMIMPFGKNYGYWTDNSLKLNDFIKTFQATKITESEFNERWGKFERKS